MKAPPAPGARRVDLVPVDELVPAARNPRVHALDGIARSLERFGMGDLVVLDERTGRVVSGHGRIEAVKALKDRGAEPPSGVPVVRGRWLVPVVRGWSSDDDAEAEAYLLAANRHQENGGWDAELLREMVADLADYEVDLVRAAGWDELAQHDLLAADEPPEPVPPEEFRPIPDRDGDYRCPACGHAWAGNPWP